MKLSAFPRILCACFVFAFAMLGTMAVAQTVDNKPEVKQEILDRVTRLLTQNAYVPSIDFSQWPAFLESEKPKLAKAANDEEFSRGVNEALDKFGASHIVLITPRATEIRRSGSTVGIGVTSQTTPEGLLIIRAVPGAPAAVAGLGPGDIILEVDGKKVEGIKGIPGPEGMEVHLKVKKVDGKILELGIIREKFSTLRPEELSWVNRDTARLSVYTFDMSYDADRVETLFKEASKAKNIILDLRDNLGGAVVNMEHLLSFFIPDQKPIGTFVNRKLVDKFVSETGGKPTDLAAIGAWSTTKVTPSRSYGKVFTGNLVVLVNGYSGSAAEIAAAALRDTVGAEVIGSKSAGAVLVSIIVPAADGFMLQYPLSDYVTIKGLRLEGNGVKPDIEAKDALYRLPTSPDVPVQKAIEYFAIAEKNGKNASN